MLESLPIQKGTQIEQKGRRLLAILGNKADILYSRGLSYSCKKNHLSAQVWSIQAQAVARIPLT